MLRGAKLLQYGVEHLSELLVTLNLLAFLMFLSLINHSLIQQRRKDAQTLAMKFFEVNRDDWIRTSDPFVPNEVRYQAALHPEAKNVILSYHDSSVYYHG